MKARLALAATAADTGRCHEGANVSVDLTVDGEHVDICLPPGESGAPGLPELPPLELPQPPLR